MRTRTPPRTSECSFREESYESSKIKTPAFLIISFSEGSVCASESPSAAPSPPPRASSAARAGSGTDRGPSVAALGFHRPHRRVRATRPGRLATFACAAPLGPPPAATPLTRSLEPAFDMAPPRAARASRPRAFPGLALALALLFASAAVSEAYYYGRYRGYGGVTVVRRTAVVRRPRGFYGRRLAQADDAVAEPPLASAPAPAPAGDDGGDDDDDASECDTILDIVRTRPELSQLAEALSDLPRLRRALDRVDRDGDTFFAPTNAAIDALLAWGGFVEKAEVRRPSASGVSAPSRTRRRLSDAAPTSSTLGRRAKVPRRFFFPMMQ